MHQSSWEVFLLLTGFIFSSAQVSKLGLVNPLIGTGGHRHPFSGSGRSYGKVQLDPDARLNGGGAYSGNHISDQGGSGFHNPLAWQWHRRLR